MKRRNLLKSLALLPLLPLVNIIPKERWIDYAEAKYMEQYMRLEEKVWSESFETSNPLA